MKKTALFAAFALLAAGCPKEQAGGSADEARDALPTAEYLHIDMPAHAAKPMVGQVATFYLLSLGTAVTLNGGAAFVLILVKTITAFPVTSVEGEKYIWGPWHDANKPSEYRLTVELTEDGDYAWTLEGRLVASGPTAPYRAVVTGVATPGHPHRGSGNFMLDFDMSKTLDPASDGEGQLSVTYDLEHDVSLVMDAEKLAPSPGGGTALATFHYTYQENANRSGELTFSFYGDGDDPGNLWEMYEVDTRWTNLGAGRADVKVTGGDVGIGAVQATECWGSTFQRTYYADSVLWTPTEGNASSCAF